MVITFSNNLFHCLLLPAVLFLWSCKEDERCSEFLNEQEAPAEVYSVESQQAISIRNSLLKRFNATSIAGQNHNAYHLIFFSSHGYGKSIKFEKRGADCLLSLTCLPTDHRVQDKVNYQLNISQEEWDVLENMIHEFGFWTEDQLITSREVLDGSVYLLEGNRPEAARCDRRSSQLIVRGSPRYDKMAALCGYIMEYEDHLDFSHRQN
jgi:hypothetical protein